MNTIKIFAAYHWFLPKEDERSKRTDKNKSEQIKNEDSRLAIKEIIRQISSRLGKYHDKNIDSQKVKLFYSRLRPTSGTFILSSIRERMSTAYALIFDLTNFNPNVMLELGIALELQSHIKDPARIFLIANAENYSDALLPSDLRGYFLTTYKIDSKTQKITLGDNGSIVMSIVSNIIERHNFEYIEDDDEL